MALSPTDRDRLAKVLRLLTSPHDGERATAADRAQEMMRRLGLDWGQVIGGVIERVVPVTRRRDREREPDDLEKIRRCEANSHELTAWEDDFIRSISQSLR